MAGYDFNQGMSNNAVAAYADGEKPMTRWSKMAIIKALDELFEEEVVNFLKTKSLSFLKAHVLEKSSWHHSSKFYNKTIFYKIKVQLDLCTLRNIDEDVCCEKVKKIKITKKAVFAILKIANTKTAMELLSDAFGDDIVIFIKNNASTMGTEVLPLAHFAFCEGKYGYYFSTCKNKDTVYVFKMESSDSRCV